MFKFGCDFQLVFVISRARARICEPNPIPRKLRFGVILGQVRPISSKVVPEGIFGVPAVFHAFYIMTRHNPVSFRRKRLCDHISDAGCGPSDIISGLC